ncbi:NUDIX domain-containing protein [Lacihabitans sp. CS3-21]|uniref:NUDIX domain-containing protein n=1 Tax=Lacihabitans sp. CS3-21 TaxID=2487332 RepID=UPI0020CE2D4F|nr:NUDIX hydrolase [Lacihabitans sp. CS3-21]MCP9747234.1 NUDIX hydrolase [Lacihabitans sp. CS3-21]
MNYSEDIIRIYGNKTRIRVCGILEKDGKYLLVNHSKLNVDNVFWNFPGGGVDNNESIEHTLTREFKEETNLDITIGKFLFINQVITSSLHAIELYFSVFAENFDNKTGYDPEIDIITETKWMTEAEILNLSTNHKPGFFSNLKSINDLNFRFQA